MGAPAEKGQDGVLNNPLLKLVSKLFRMATPVGNALFLEVVL